MKKLLGVSIAALLAVSPMVAHATKTASAITGDKLTAPKQANNQIATTSYVKGAYADIAAEHNKVVADITVPAVEQGQENYGAITTTGSVADNLVALDTAIKTLGGNAAGTYQTISASTVAGELVAGDNGDHITSGNGVGANLTSLNTAVKANDSAIATLNSGDTQAGSVDYKIKNQAESAVYTADTTNGKNLTANTDLNTAIDTLDQAMGSKSALTSNTGVLNTAANRADLVTAIVAINDELASTASANTTNLNVTSAGNFIGTGTNVASNLGALDGAASQNSRAISGILDSNITVYGSWNGGGTPSGSQTVSIASLQPTAVRPATVTVP